MCCSQQQQLPLPPQEEDFHSAAFTNDVNYFDLLQKPRVKTIPEVVLNPPVFVNQVSYVDVSNNNTTTTTKSIRIQFVCINKPGGGDVGKVEYDLYRHNGKKIASGMLPTVCLDAADADADADDSSFSTSATRTTTTTATTRTVISHESVVFETDDRVLGGISICIVSSKLGFIQFIGFGQQQQQQQASSSSDDDPGRNSQNAAGVATAVRRGQCDGLFPTTRTGLLLMNDDDDKDDDVQQQQKGGVSTTTLQLTGKGCSYNDFDWSKRRQRQQQYDHEDDDDNVAAANKDQEFQCEEDDDNEMEETSNVRKTTQLPGSSSSFPGNTQLPGLPVFINEVSNFDTKKGSIEFVCALVVDDDDNNDNNDSAFGRLQYFLYRSDGKRFDSGSLSSVCHRRGKNNKRSKDREVVVSSESITWKKNKAEDGLSICLWSNVLGMVQFLEFSTTAAAAAAGSDGSTTTVVAQGGKCDGETPIQVGDGLLPPVDDDDDDDTSSSHGKTGKTLRLQGTGCFYEDFTWSLSRDDDDDANIGEIPNPSQVFTCLTVAAPTPTPTTSRSPTMVPTVIPTTSPTAFPSVFPSMSPTFQPTSFPTERPSLRPSTIPTAYPTNLPSYLPTDAPTLSGAPSHAPSPKPSWQPSQTPTVSLCSRCIVALKDTVTNKHENKTDDGSKTTTSAPSSAAPKKSEPCNICGSRGGSVQNPSDTVDISWLELGDISCAEAKSKGNSGDFGPLECIAVQLVVESQNVCGCGTAVDSDQATTTSPAPTIGGGGGGGRDSSTSSHTTSSPTTSASTTSGPISAAPKSEPCNICGARGGSVQNHSDTVDISWLELGDISCAEAKSKGNSGDFGPLECIAVQLAVKSQNVCGCGTTVDSDQANTSGDSTSAPTSPAPATSAPTTSAPTSSAPISAAPKKSEPCNICGARGSVQNHSDTVDFSWLELGDFTCAEAKSKGDSGDFGALECIAVQIVVISQGACGCGTGDSDQANTAAAAAAEAEDVTTAAAAAAAAAEAVTTATATATDVASFDTVSDASDTESINQKMICKEQCKEASSDERQVRKNCNDMCKAVLEKGASQMEACQMANLCP